MWRDFHRYCFSRFFTDLEKNGKNTNTANINTFTVNCYYVNQENVIVLGGEGGVGYVQELVTWGKDSYRGAVQILWKADNMKKNYRVGGEGCVDVIYTRMEETASGGNYYADHLPLVGKLSLFILILYII